MKPKKVDILVFLTTYIGIGLAEFFICFIIIVIVTQLNIDPLFPAIILLIFMKVFDKLIITKIPCKNIEPNLCEWRYKISYLTILICIIIYYVIHYISINNL